MKSLSHILANSIHASLVRSNVLVPEGFGESHWEAIRQATQRGLDSEEFQSAVSLLVKRATEEVLAEHLS